MAKEKVIGLIGGMTWQTTVDYYTILNERINILRGDRYTPRIAVSSINLQEYVDNLENGRPQKNVDILVDHASLLIAAGAECLGMCSNTAHLFAEEVQARISIPLVDIAVATAKSVNQRGLKNVVVLGTGYTMRSDFYTKKLNAVGIERIALSAEQEQWVHATIFDELTRNQFLDLTRRKYLDLIEQLKQNGVEGVVLGCTEIPLLIRGTEMALPTFDTLALHCEALINFAYAS